MRSLYNKEITDRKDKKKNKDLDVKVQKAKQE
jgi:hypothetical protein